MAEKTDFFKRGTGKDINRWAKIPTFEEIIAKQLKRGKSDYELRLIGSGNEDVWITEEERIAHMHIIGTGGMGKSSLLEYLIREDIDRGNGLCFLDPSWLGNTMKRVLAYCQSIGHNKVIVIDPHDRWDYRRIVPLNPFSKYKSDSVTLAMAIAKTLFGMKDMADFLRIERYYSALLGVLHQAGMTINESKYFMSFNDPYSKMIRDKILALSEIKAVTSKEKGGEGLDYDEDGTIISEVYKSLTMFQNVFGSTINRLTPFSHETLRLMFGTRERLDWAKLVKEGWVVLVNLHTGGNVRPLHSKLLGTAVISLILDAFERLGRCRWEGRSYIYVDECGQFITDQVIDFLWHKRQAGLGMVLAHQANAQFPSMEAKEAIAAQAKIKIAFKQPSPKDRAETARMMYVGELAGDVDSALANLRKQQAVVKLEKGPARFVWIPDLKSVDPLTKDFMRHLYRMDIYQDDNEIIHDQKQRVYPNTNEIPIDHDTSRTSNPPPKKRPVGAKGSVRKTPPPKRPDNNPPEWEDTFRSLREDEVTYSTNEGKQPPSSSK